MAIPIRERMRLKPIPASPELKAERLAICEQCEWARLNVTGWCKRCRRPFHQRIEHDHELACQCGGEIRVAKEFAQCGACGCPLATRTHYARLPGYGPVTCPKGKW